MNRCEECDGILWPWWVYPAAWLYRLRMWLNPPPPPEPRSPAVQKLIDQMNEAFLQTWESTIEKDGERLSNILELAEGADSYTDLFAYGEHHADRSAGDD